ncbi:MAG: glycosyltransferase family 4 protein [Desulfovibrio sp.]|jgi:glycosyltransferase involved in cell wall biosynthesis|nr:glycosyltransferase family 4 protein [Desulfovibrio sp.]
MKKKHIALLITPRPEYGGMFQYAAAVLDALAELDPSKYRVSVCSPQSAWRRRARAKGLRAMPIPRFFHGKIRNILAKIPIIPAREHLLALWDAVSPLRLLALLLKMDTILFSQPQYMELPGNIPQIGCIHDLMHRYEPGFPEAGDPQEFAWREQLYKGIVGHCHAILVDSETGKNHVREAYGAEPAQIFVLPYAIRGSLKSAAPVRPSNLPSGVEDGFLFYPAQFWLHKNHQRLVEAVARLSPRLDIHCVFSGDTRKNGYAPFCERVAKLGLRDKVHCIGYVSESGIAWLYRHARCMVMPTFFGPTNIPPLEAMHFGCPVGVSGIYGMPEQLGDAPLYFNPRSVDEIADVIAQLYENRQLRERCIENGFAVAALHEDKQFSLRMSQIIDDVFASNDKRKYR